MAQACTVCSHQDHLTIDASILGAGTARLSHRAIAQTYGLSRAAVQRHAASHVAPIMRAVVDQAGLLHAETMLSELGALYERAVRLLDTAEASGDHRVTVGAIREARQVVESFAKVGLAMAQHQAGQAEEARPDLDVRLAEALARREYRRALPISGGAMNEVEEAIIVDPPYPPT